MASGLSDKSPAEPRGGIPTVFISYAHEDKPLALGFADRLKAHGLRVWIDDNELLVGDSLIEQISAAVADIDFFCPLVSNASRNSDWCRKELSLAMTRGIGNPRAVVMPLRVGDVVMPASIIDKVYVTVNPEDVTSAVDRIARDVQRHRKRWTRRSDNAGAAVSVETPGKMKESVVAWLQAHGWDAETDVVLEPWGTFDVVAERGDERLAAEVKTTIPGPMEAGSEAQRLRGAQMILGIPLDVRAMLVVPGRLGSRSLAGLVEDGIQVYVATADGLERIA